MNEIRNRFTGAVLKTIAVDTLSDADLSGADLSGANLSGADLRHADLSGANLSGANLSGADLRHADLSGANLSGADLSDAILRHANLSGADLSGADLSGADLSGADLSDAILRHADLSGANLSDANLSDADLSDAIELPLPAGHDAAKLRAAVADQIELHPELHDQTQWGEGAATPNPEACGTPCCVAGWACRIGGGENGLGVATMASILLFQPGKPTPSFDAENTRERILKDLRA
jgi:uncharacterized protein YjbI with pentapeptide repeats